MRHLRTVTILLLTIIAGGCRGSEATPILVGHIAPSPDRNPAISENAHRGILLALEEANQDGPLVSGRQVKVLHPACRPDGDSVRAAAVRLTAVDKVIALVGGPDPAQALALGQVAETAKVPLVAAGGAPAKAGDRFAFHLSVSSAYHGGLLAEQAVAQFPNGKTALLVSNRHSTSEFARQVTTAFAAAFRKAGGTTLGEWPFQTSADLKELTDRLKSDEIDFIFLAGAVDDLIELRRAGLSDQIPIILAAPDGAITLLTSNPIKNPVITVTAFLATELAETPLVRKYQDRFTEPPDVHAALAYDSARLLFEGMRRAGEPDSTKLRDALAEIKQFDTVTGPIRFDGERWAIRPMFVVWIENGVIKRTDRVNPKSSAGQ